MGCKYFVYVILLVKAAETTFTLSDSTATAFPCNDNKQFIMSYELSATPEDQETRYSLYLHHYRIKVRNTIVVKFTDPANINLYSGKYAIAFNDNPNEVKITYYKEKVGGTGVDVVGTNNTKIPYITSIKINGEEKCKEPNLGVFDDILKDPQVMALYQSLNQSSGPVCGRRQLHHTELITNSIQSKPGDWPWHVAIYRQEKQSYDYKCGGTLLSKNIVLTAAHCVLRKGIKKLFPVERMKVYLGKYNLYEKDANAVEKEIKNIIVHEKFNISTIDHDIALIQLKEDVEFGSYIQPACLWNPKHFKNDSNNLHGTVVGWGFEITNRLAPQLRQATLPIIDRFTCVLSNNVFFGKHLDDNKFCAGYKNGTSPCNGDSGGGFVIFAPDKINNKNLMKGSWYVRGIVSIGVSRRDISICEPNEYVLFTDVGKYIHWIENNVDFNVTDVTTDYDDQLGFKKHEVNSTKLL